MTNLTNRNLSLYGLVALLLLLALSAYAAADPAQEFRLNLEQGASSSIDIPLNTSGLIPLVLISKKDSTSTIKSLELQLSSFIGSDHGDELPVELMIDSKGVIKTKTGYSGISPHVGLINLELKVPKLPDVGNYVGDLFLLSDNQAVLRDWRITLKAVPDRNATLVLGRNAITLPVILPDVPDATVHLWEESEKLPIFGVTARPETLKGDGVTELNWQKQLSFKFNGVPITDIDETISATAASTHVQPSRDIAAGAQAKVDIGFHDLEPGRYGVALHFGARNSKGNDKQGLLLTLLVKDRVSKAIFILLLAIVISYMSTKWLTLRRSRLLLLRRIDALRPDWVLNEPAVVPVIWYVATLKQAENRVRHRFLAVAEVNDLLEKATLLLPLLDKIRHLRIGINEAPYEMLVKRRAQQDLSDLVRRLGRTTYTKESLAEFDGALGNLESWLVESSMITRYCAQVEASISQLLVTLQIDGLEDAITQAAKHPKVAAKGVDNLKKKINKTLVDMNTKPPQAKLDTSLDREREYSWLKLLWQRRKQTEFADLLVLDPRREFDDIYTVADKAVWQRIEENHKALGFELPTINKGVPTEAFTGITFSIASGIDDIDESYLFNYALKYKWKISIHQKGNRTPFTLTPQTTEPRVTQFSPIKGALSAEVEIFHEKTDTPIEIKMGERMPISNPKFMRAIRAFDTTEVVALLIATGVAVVTGLITFYYKNPTFGNAQDYITLFLWGVGFDQSKNFLQTLQQVSPGTK